MTIKETVKYHAINEPFKVYNSKRDQFTTSGVLKDFRKDPGLVGVKKEFPKEAGVNGAAIHSYILTPFVFEKEFAVMPQFELLSELEEYKSPKSTKLYKELVSEFQTKNQGKEIISQDVFSNIKEMKNSYLRNPLIDTFFTSGYLAERTFRWCPTHDDYYQIRADLITFDNSVDEYDLHDLKTIEELHLWKTHINRFGYDLQLYFYAYILEQITGKLPRDITIHFIEKKEPFRTALCYLPSLRKDDANYEMIEDLLSRYSHCKKLDRFESIYQSESLEYTPYERR